jgi:hypothetical protein
MQGIEPVMNETSVLSVVLGTLGFAVLTIFGTFIFALVWGRYLQWKMQNLPSMMEQLRVVVENKGEEIVLWHRRGCLFSIIWFLLAVLLIVTGNWIFVPVLLILALPLGMILNGLTAMKTQFVWDQFPFRPIGLLSGNRAVRRGKMLIVVGFAFLLLCVLCTLASAVSTH